MNKLPIELKAEISSYLQNPFLLGSCSRSWHTIVNLPHTKYRWIFNQYGRIHALFHAVRIGKPLLDVELTELLLKNTHISRYFVYRLKLGYYGKHGLWGSNISKDIYDCILNYKKEYTSNDCDDMQLIRQVLERTKNENENEKDLKTIIETHGLTPFPPSPTFRTYIFENFDESEDDLFPGGYATASDLKIIAKVIINHQHLSLTIWKKMGYHEIIADLENAVVQLTLLELYSTGVPSIQAVAEKLCQLQSIGFPLTDTVIGNCLLLFARRLIDVGESLIEGFSIARKMCKADVLEMCLIDFLDPSRNLKHIDALNYVINAINNPEKQILSALEKFKSGNNLSQLHTSLKYPLVVYRYMLRFNAKSSVVSYLMKEILIVHSQLEDTDDADKLRDADTILDEYYAANVPFDPSLLSLFKKCLRTKPISYLFEGYLANLFGSEIQSLFLTPIPVPEVDALVSPTQTIELKQRWLGEIQKSISSDEFMSDGFIRQAIDFLTLYNLS